MSVNPELVGRSFPPTAPYLVGREKVREFARAVFADAAQHIDPDAARALGYADVVAPPTFAMVIQDLTLQQLLAEEDSGIALERTVHAEQRFRYTRPIVAGDESSRSCRSRTSARSARGRWSRARPRSRMPGVRTSSPRHRCC